MRASADRVDPQRRTLTSEVLPVTAIVPAYNRAHLLGRALDSIASQRPGRPAEVIVIDDASTDGTHEVATRWGAVVIRHEHNRGLAAARNTGMRAASHEWVALLDSDDEWLPHHLAALWAIRDGHALVASSALWCGADPARDRFQGPVRRRPVVLTSPAPLLFAGNFIPASATMLRRAIALESGGFRARLGVVEDLDLWARLLDRHSGIVSPAIGLIYHVHGAQMSSDHRTMQAAHLAVAEDYRDRPWWSDAGLERRRATVAWDNLRLALAAGEVREALGFALLIARKLQRVRGLLATWGLRFLVRRRSAMLARDGGPSVVDLTGRRSPLALVRLAARPAGLVVVNSRWQALCARAAGLRTVRATPRWSRDADLPPDTAGRGERCTSRGSTP